MNSKALDRAYFEWLVNQFDVDPAKYWAMFERLHLKEFVWIVPNDDNRIEDAKEVRKQFYRMYQGEGKDHLIPDEGTSILEVVVGLSRRISFQTGIPAEEWAWKLIENLGLDEVKDREKINDVLEALVWRTYERNGKGGFFPLKEPKEDQTQVEIWYQMHAYIIEHAFV